MASSSSSEANEYIHLHSLKTKLETGFDQDASDHINKKHIKAKLKSQMKETTGLVASTFSITMTEMGTGSLALPYVIRMWGIIFGIIFLFLFYFINVYTSNLMLKVKNITGNCSFSSIGKKAFGRGGSIVVKILVIMNNFGSTLAFIIIFTTGVPELIKDLTDNKVVTNHYFITLLFCAIYFGIIYLRDLKILSYASGFGVAGMIIFCITVIYSAIDKLANSHEHIPAQKFSGEVGMITCLPAVIYAYCYQYNFYPIYTELKNPTDKRMRLAFTSGLSFSLVVYIAVANCGYFVFLGDTKPNVVDNYKKEHHWYDYVVSLSILSHIPVVLPLMFFECRNNFLLILDDIKEYRQRLNEQKESPPGTPMPYESPTEKQKRTIIVEQQDPQLFWIGTTMLYIAIILIVTFFPNVQSVFTFTGAIGANSVSFIIPCAFYLKLGKGPLTSKEKLVPLIIFILGIILMFFSVGAEIYSFFA